MKRLWLWTMVLTIALISMLEVVLRQSGYQPSVRDNAVLWSIERRKIEAADTSKQVLIVGASRAQMGLNPEVIKQQLPDSEPIMLAVKGGNCLPALDDIAYNTEFNGTILCSFTSHLSYGGTDIQEQWIEQYHRMRKSGAWLNSFADQSIKTMLQEHLALVRFDPYTLIRNLLVERRLPDRTFVHMQANRFLPADYYAIV
jgi:hypothetical protein